MNCYDSKSSFILFICFIDLWSSYGEACDARDQCSPAVLPTEIVPKDIPELGAVKR